MRRTAQRTAILVSMLSSLALSALACGPLHDPMQQAEPRLELGPSATRAVTDGVTATAAQIGSTVALIDPGYGDNFCTGTLIAPRVVVTAAHCLQWDGELTAASDVTVAAGVTQAAGAAVIEVTTVIPHPDYVESGAPTNDPDGLGNDRDIGVLLLAADVTTAQPTPVLPLSLVDVALQAGTPMIIAGFGMTQSNGDGDYGVLYVANTPYERRSAGELIAGASGQPDTCGGDSGGPAYVDYAGVRYVAGATSRAKLSAQDYCGGGGIYTLVSAFDAWIDEVAGGLYDGAGAGAGLPDVGDGPPPSADDGSAGSCASLCGGFDDTAGCGCDPACAQFGDCCADFTDSCGDLAGWGCAVDTFGDGACDCGCGATDVDCAELAADKCESTNCDTDQVVSADLARCESPTSDTPTAPDSSSTPGLPDAPGANDSAVDVTDEGPHVGGLSAEVPTRSAGCRASGDGAGSSSSVFGLALALLAVARRRR